MHSWREMTVPPIHGAGAMVNTEGGTAIASQQDRYPNDRTKGFRLSRRAISKPNFTKLFPRGSDSLSFANSTDGGAVTNSALN